MTKIKSVSFYCAATRVSLGVLLALLMMPMVASAQDGTWKSGTGSGVWSSASNWTSGTVPGGAGSSVNFTTGNGGSIFATIDGGVASRTAGTINLGGSSIWTVDATGSGTLTMNNSGSNAQINILNSGSGGTHTISAPISLASSLNVDNADAFRSLTISGSISESGGARSITKTGVGLLYFTFNFANSYSGGFTLNGGSVRGDNNGSYGTGAITLTSGTILNTGGSRTYSNTLSIAGDVTLGDATNGGVNNFSGTTTLTNGNRIINVAGSTGLTGNIGDGGNGYSLTKSGSGTLILGVNGGGGNNTFSGGFVLNAGAVTLAASIGVNTMLGSGTATLNGGSLSTLFFNRNLANVLVLGGDVDLNSGAQGGNGATITYSGTGTLTGNRILSVSGSGRTANLAAIGDGGNAYSLTKDGVGTLALTGSNTYTGGTIVSGGILALGSSERLANSGALTINGGEFAMATFAETVGAVTMTSGTISSTSNTAILTASSYSASAGSFNTILAGSGTFTKTGAGTVTFGAANNQNNTYSGGTVINQGTLALGVSNRLTDTGSITVNGGALDLGAFNDTVGAVTLAGGSITSTSGTLFASSYVAQSGSASAILGGSAALSKTTSGTATLNGINTYSGTTSVSAGTLIVSGSGTINSSSAVSLTGGRLKYDSSTALSRAVTINGGALAYNSSANYSGSLTFTSGTVGGTNLAGSLNNLTIGTNQTISPGNSPGTAATGSQTWAGGGSYLWEINNATGTAGSDPGWDLLTGSGSLSITATSGSKFTIYVTSLTLSNVAGNATNFSSTTNYQWMIADFSSAITLDLTAFNVDVSGFSNSVASGSIFSLALGNAPGIGGDNTQLYLTYAVPEPSAWILFGLGMTVVLFRRRRRI